ncbi:uncharacterized protein CTRU02_215692 [Colletotrichum truncatum]|uniref:Uncharacterized protein n=1 Tax=Colletotrichum truncatum TaxID=5467 RepID=A0ACC3YBV9_COLTU
MVTTVLPIDETLDSLERCLSLAIQLSCDLERPNNAPTNNDVPSNEFSLEPDCYVELIRRLESDHRVSLDKLHLEYEPDARLLRFKMTQGRLHSAMASQLGDLLRDIARNVLPDIQAIRETPRVNMEDHTPRVVAEVAHSHPTTLDALEERCTEFLSCSAGYVRAVIAIKIPYSPGKPIETLLDELDRCFVALWVWQDGAVKRELPWTKITAQDAVLSLRISHLRGLATRASTHRKTRRRGPKGRRTRRPNSSNDFIRIPFATLEAELRKAVHWASLDPTTR